MAKRWRVAGGARALATALNRTAQFKAYEAKLGDARIKAALNDVEMAKRQQVQRLWLYGNL